MSVMKILRNPCQILAYAASRGWKGMLSILKCLAMVLALLAVGGCAYHNTLMLENGEKVDSLYYHESWMPDEVMVEMWIG